MTDPNKDQNDIIHGHADETLRESEILYRELFENIPVGIGIADQKGNLLAFNDAMLEPGGYTRQDIQDMGNNVLALYYDPDQRADALATYQKQGFLRKFPVQFKRKDGTPYDTLLSLTLILFKGQPCIQALVEDITERKRAEAALGEGRQRLAGIIGSAMDAIISVDENQRITLFNAAAEQMFHCSAVEVLGQPLDRFIPARFRDIHHSEVKAFGQSHMTKRTMGRMDAITITGLRADGTEFPAEASISQTETAGKKVYTVILRDVTERKKAEKLPETLLQISNAAISVGTLEELYLSFHRALQSIMLADNFYIALCDPATGLLSFPYFVDEKEQAPEPYPLGHGLTEYVLRSREPLLGRQEMIEKLIRKGEIESIGAQSIDWLGVPLNVLDKTIGVMAVQTYKQGVRYTQRELDILTIVSSQVAQSIERKRAEESLRENEEKYRTLVERASDGIAIIQNGAVKYLNQRLAEMRGESVEEIMGSRFDAFLHPDERAKILEYYRRRMAGEQVPSTYITALLRSDNTEVSAEISAGKISYKGSSADLVIVRDITERKRAEASLRESEKRYRTIFESAGVPIWEEDYSAVMEAVSALRSQGITDFSRYLDEHPEFVTQAARMIKILDVNQAVIKMLGAGDKAEVLVSLDKIFDGLPPKTFRELILTLAEGRKHYENESYAYTVQGKRRDEWITITLPAENDKYDRVLVSTLDITELKNREHELETIASVSTTLRAAQTRAEMLTVIVEQTMSLTGAEGAALLLRDPASGETVVEAAHGKTSVGTGSRIPPDKGIAGHVIKTGQPYITNDLPNDPLVYYHEPSAFTSFVSVPLTIPNGTIGALQISGRTPFPDSLIPVLTSVANMAANAIQRVSLYEESLSHAQELSQAYEETLAGWARALELRDEPTEGHTRRVVDLTLRLARDFNVPEADLKDIRRGTILHDIGKMGIPDAILLKRGPLTLREKKIMQRHPQYAYDMLSSIPFLQASLDIPFCHHEHWDGKGYPRGLKGVEIPLAARIFAVVDVWDALRSDRPYRKAWSKAKTLKYIRDQSGKQFDSKVVKQFLALEEIR